MSFFTRLDGILNNLFSIGKGNVKVEIRTNSGVLQGKNYGGSWQNILGQGGSEAFSDMKEPTGFVNITDSQISFDNGTRTFTIEPKSPATSFDIYHKGTKITKTGTITKTITDTDGIWFIYFDSNGDIQASQTTWDFAEIVPIATVYWNATLDVGFLGEERHGITMDSATHSYLHRTVGARYESGLSLSGYTLDTDSDSAVTFGISDGFISDEDLRHNIKHASIPTNPFEQVLSDPAELPVYYRDGSSGVWRRDTATDYAFKNTASGRINYNEFTGSTWQQTQITDNYFVAYWVFASNDPNYPIISIQGQRQDASLIDAQNNNKYENLSFGGLPFQELKLLYRIILNSKDTYLGTTKSKISDIQDLRSVSNLPAGTYVATAHSSLTGLTSANAHPASAISTSVTNFDNLLTSSETNVQSALEKLDEHTHTPITTVSNTNYTASSSDRVLIVTTGNFNRTITLPSASSMNGREITIKKIDIGTGKVTVDGNASETIDGNLTLDIESRYSFLTLISDGTDWHIISGSLWN